MRTPLLTLCLLSLVLTAAAPAHAQVQQLLQQMHSQPTEKKAPAGPIETPDGCKLKNVPGNVTNLARYASDLAWQGRCVKGFAHGAATLTRAFHNDNQGEVWVLIYKGAYVNGDMTGVWLELGGGNERNGPQALGLDWYEAGELLGGSYRRERQQNKATIALGLHIPVLENLSGLAATRKIPSIPVAELERDMRLWSSAPEWKPTMLVAAADAPMVAGRLTPDQVNRPVTRERLREVFDLQRWNVTNDEIAAVLALPKGKPLSPGTFSRCVAKPAVFADAGAEAAYAQAPSVQRMLMLWGHAHYGVQAALGTCVDLALIARQWQATAGRAVTASLTAEDIAPLRTTWLAARTTCSDPLKTARGAAQNRSSGIDASLLHGGMTAEQLNQRLIGASCSWINKTNLSCEGNLRFGDAAIDRIQAVVGDEGTLATLTMNSPKDAARIGTVLDRAFGPRKTELETFQANRQVDKELGRRYDLEVGPGGRLTEVEVRIIGKVEQQGYTTRASHTWKTDMFEGYNSESLVSLTYARCR